MSSREKFEAWWEENYHNGNPPRFGWGAWRDSDGYQIDDDEPELDGMWQAWQAAELASEQKLTDLAVQLANAESRVAEVVAENGQMLRLLTDISENHDEYVNADEYLYAGVPMDYVSEINAYVSRDVNAENPFKATDEYLAGVRASGAEEYGNLTIKIGEEEGDEDIVYAGKQALLFAAKLRSVVTVEGGNAQ